MPDGIDIPTFAPVDWGAISPIVQLRRQLAQEEQQNQIAAIRYQGQREFEDLIKGGAKPEEALRKAAPRLFYGDPRSMFGAIKSTMPRTMPYETPVVSDIGGVRVVHKPGAAGFKVLSEEQKGQMTDVARANAAGRSAALKFQQARAVERGELNPESPSYKQIDAAIASLDEFVHAKPKKTTTPAPGVGIAPMPRTKGELRKGVVYQTPRGAAQWDGEKFIPQ